MSARLARIIAVLIGLVSLPGWASLSVKNMTESDLAIFRADPVYQEIHSLCSTEASLIDSEMYQSQVFKDVFKGSSRQVFRAGKVDHREFFSLWADSGGSRVFKNLMFYPAYRLAVHDCFPNDLRAQHKFSERIVLADTVGRSYGLGKVLALYSGLGYGLRYGARKIGIKYPRVTGIAFAAVGLAFTYTLFDSARKQFFGLTKKEQKQALDFIRQRAQTQPRIYEEQMLELYDQTISDLQAQLQETPADHPIYKVIEERLQRLVSHRPEILARIESYDTLFADEVDESAVNQSEAINSEDSSFPSAS